MTVKVLDAGHRERQALLTVFNAAPWTKPFWQWLEEVQYDVSRDEFIFPGGATMPVQKTDTLVVQ